MAQACSYFGAMARNNAWANAQLLGACAALTQEDFVAPRTGFFPSIKATLNHILAVDRYYLDGLRHGGRGAELFLATDYGSVDDLEPAQAEQDAALTAFCDALAPQDLERTVAFDRGEGGIWHERIDLVLLHLFQHQVHHRGQVHAMLAGTPVAPPQLDEFFIDFDRDPQAGAVFGGDR
ncbi:DinB family protein [Polymorphum gilvum]|uniref:Nuclease inhibitor n=1 Tax=Polymorphum gilvum (strain LMG 25793 / CGMCC 1.9160 / SL003B-26A1) TaxID=991905 RepID=F2IW96_POLGS|nr:DinB family protein [Polymorphum gilvum]ADZ71481.1 Nuclease inhibitor [Polymorphum gilvum SL003B-26A1]